MLRDAVISDCGNYRYELSRQWGDSSKYVLFIGLNPSTADSELDDQTASKCIGFAKRWRYSQLKIVNLFAYRHTDSSQMKSSLDTIGSLNDEITLRLCDDADLIVVCWGNNGSHMNRDQDVIELIKSYSNKIKCLGKNIGGQPKHPERISYSSELESFF